MRKEAHPYSSVDTTGPQHGDYSSEFLLFWL